LEEIKKYEIAITGTAFQMMMESIENLDELESNKKLYQALIKHAKIFARMSPDHKAMLVEQLQNGLNDMIGMCGDGANDCKALKTADVGLSLSEAEASIAAPFTSKIPNISPIYTLLKEGRASLVTCFQVFKFIALYSMVQFCSVVFLYLIGSNVGNWQFFYIDMFIVIPLSLTMSRTGPYNNLDRRRPIGHLISFTVLFSVIGQILIQIGFQTAIFYYLRTQDWFVPLKPDDTKRAACHETTVIFYAALPQYLIVVIAFSVGKPFRTPMYSNPSLTLTLIFLILLNLLFLFYPFGFIKSFLQLAYIPMKFRFVLLGISIGNFLFSYLWEVGYTWISRKRS
jgi:cation-transporting P-type ATPase 13A2